MKTLLALLLFSIPFAASATVQCTQVGTSTYCYDTDTGQHWSCTQVGTSTYCN